MGNITNEKQWAGMERLRFIERAAFWRGWVKRSDLMEHFGVSPAQATADLQKFQELCPDALSYSLNRKRYEGLPGMACSLQEPVFDEAVAFFLGSGFPQAKWGIPSGGVEVLGKVAGVVLPVREGKLLVQRAVLRAILNGLRLRVKYQTMSGKPVSWRWIRPHALGHDGYRWHVRAWGEESEWFLDFVLSRITEVEWPEEAGPLPEQDEDWETWEDLILVPNPVLTPEQQATIAADYGMRNERLKLRVRRAMVDYTLAHLRLPLRSGNEEINKVVLVNRE